MYSLCNQEEAIKKLAHLIDANCLLALEVNEDKCFGPDQWLSLGLIQVYPPTQMEFEAKEELNERAIRYGHFTWQLPQQDAIQENLLTVLGNDEKESAKALKPVIEAIQDVTRRLCLLFQTFDPSILPNLPFRRPTTLVTDTSAVMQGALDFAVRFLYPMARIKVPTIVSVETTNMADNFMSLRRSSSLKKALCLQQHLKSQGIQRVLIRTQLHSDIEVESPVQENDPWRVIFTDDIDDEARKTGLTTVHRSLYDRLILDSARQHLARLSPGHNLFILTSDQGMARMALAEGLNPLFFESRKSSNPLGRLLTGTPFHPFISQFFGVSLTSLLWEIATCFGSARLRRVDGPELMRVVALSEDIIWFPYQSREDLLWCRFETKAKSTLATIIRPEIIAPQDDGIAEDLETQSEKAVTVLPKNKRTSKGVTGHGAYVISLNRLFHLIDQLVKTKKLSKEQAFSALGVKSDVTYGQYLRFLFSGGFIKETGDVLASEERLNVLWQALQHVDVAHIRAGFEHVPSFRAFLEFIEQQGKRPDWVEYSFTERRGATRAYKSLVEITASALTIPYRGICRTPNYPRVAEFTDDAMEVYALLLDTREEVLTGEWLEELAWTKGIHPLTARILLNEAYEARFLNRFFEGSTPDPRFEHHTVDVLEVSEGEPSIRQYNLYHGNFMLTDRASVRIKLERRSR